MTTTYPNVAQGARTHSIGVARHQPASSPDLGCQRVAPSLQRRFDELQITRLTGAAQRVAVRPDPDQADNWPFLLVYSASGGARVARCGVTVTLQPRDVVVFANDAELQVAGGEESVTLLVYIPVDAVGRYGPELSAADCRVSSTRRGLSQLVSRLLDGLAADLADLAPLHPGQLARHVVGFVAMAFESDPARAAVGGDYGTDPTVVRIKEYVETHLADVELTPLEVADALNVSIRTLHRAFEKESLSVAGWIRWRRLEHCSLELADPARDHESVSTIGARWGFWDAAHFSKLFKNQYGVSPRGYRRHHLITHVAEAASA